tara:strand:- start:60 stop:269 length:210 start_codon:yes stop_codon:yes gene_type:complete
MVLLVMEMQVEMPLELHHITLVVEEEQVVLVKVVMLLAMVVMDNHLLTSQLQFLHLLYLLQIALLGQML